MVSVEEDLLISGFEGIDNDIGEVVDGALSYESK
jgi:hypothetical protein